MPDRGAAARLAMRGLSRASSIAVVLHGCSSAKLRRAAVDVCYCCSCIMHLGDANDKLQFCMPRASRDPTFGSSPPNPYM
jgi:hypothetical protein